MDPNTYENDQMFPSDGDQSFDVDAQVDCYEVDWYGDLEQEEMDDVNDDVELQIPSVEQISKLLSSMSEGTAETTVSRENDREPITPSSSAGELSTGSMPKLDDELREAFLDDAGQCLAAIENAILSYEADAKNPEPLRLMGRELHTLKGASASVGLTELAEFLHQLEDSIGSNDSGGGYTGELPSAENLLAGLDEVRKVINAVRAEGADVSVLQESTPVAGETQQTTPDHSRVAFDAGDERSGDDESVRVKSSQLNRLMDMLAELVMLRNRRETELSELQGIYEELIQGVCQVRSSGDSREAGTNDQAISLPSVANGLMATAQKLRKCSQPVAEGNAAVSQFIRQFRQELVELRRTPVSGLFRRLQRVVRDAARLENKQVQLTLIGEDAGIERSLQQRLYEPLLHIVRNCVCHGIESPDQRQVAGKGPCGTITLQARSGADLFVIEIRDDGQGLNYDAIRRRGLENGLLKPNASTSDEELAQLIFRPGFSTRQTADQVAGRGVGMDVVADTLKRMRGWIEVDSVSGQGTCIRLSFPLPSVIQHAMVFRSSGQLFALPMQFVQTAGASKQGRKSARLEELMTRESSHFHAPFSENQSVSLVLTCHQLGQEQTSNEGRRVSLVVDEIVGPEEVVVRPLPTLLKQHPICCGATLSGLGETVLVLDAMRVIQSATKNIRVRKTIQKSYAETSSFSEPAPRPKVLVVDDSKSARTRVVQSLRRYDVDTVEAHDGAEAIRLMTNQHFSAVFSDMEMPNVNGMELLSAIRRDRQEHAPPVIIISSRDESSFRDAATKLGAANYLIKPLADADLDQSIQSIASLCTLTRISSAAEEVQSRNLHRAAGEVGHGSGREGAFREPVSMATPSLGPESPTSPASGRGDREIEPNETSS